MENGLSMVGLWMWYVNMKKKTYTYNIFIYIYFFSLPTHTCIYIYMCVCVWNMEILLVCGWLTYVQDGDFPSEWSEAGCNLGQVITEVQSSVSFSRDPIPWPVRRGPRFGADNSGLDLKKASKLITNHYNFVVIYIYIYWIYQIKYQCFWNPTPIGDIVGPMLAHSVAGVAFGWRRWA